MGVLARSSLPILLLAACAPDDGSDPDGATSPDDSDGDGIDDADEVAIGTDPDSADSDGEGWLDGEGVALRTDRAQPVQLGVRR